MFISSIHKPSSKSERNLITLHVSINGINNKLEELKLRIHDAYAFIIRIQENNVTQKLKYTKVHNFSTALIDMLHLARGVLIALIRDNITFAIIYIPPTINTITIANIYIPPRDSTSTHYKPYNRHTKLK